jgi:hypothetical protein
MNGISRFAVVTEMQSTARPADTSLPPSGRCRHKQSIQTRSSAQIFLSMFYILT